MLANIEANLSDFRGTPGWRECFDSQSRTLRCGPQCQRPVTVWGDVYPQCPETMRTVPQWQAVISLYNQSKISPLAGWPDAYAPWVTHAVTALEAEFSEKARRQIEEAKRRD